MDSRRSDAPSLWDSLALITDRSSAAAASNRSSNALPVEASHRIA